MNTKRRTMSAAARLAALTVLAVAGHGAWARAQTAAQVAAGLRAPTKLIWTEQGNLLVTEAGAGPNTGRVSVVEPRTGVRRTLLDGLPAGVNQAAGRPEQSGPSGLAMSGRTLYVTIGQGDAVLAGPAPGTERVNPSPASPLLSSVLALRFSSQVERTTNGFQLTPDQQQAVRGGAAVVLEDAAGARLTVELITDFPNFVAEPRPDFADNVRASNPFGVASDGRVLYVVDASLNRVHEVGAHGGGTATLTTFAKVQNPTPVGPPLIDAVPDSVRLYGDQLLVPLLTGFPFPAGKAEVRRVDLVTGENAPFIGGLTSAIDVLSVRLRRAAEDQFYVLQFSTNMLQNRPGSLLLYDSPASAPATLDGGLTSPTSVARDPQTGDLYVAEIFRGRIVRVGHSRVFVRRQYLDFFGREPEQTGWDAWTSVIDACAQDAACQSRERVRVVRGFMESAELRQNAGFPAPDSPDYNDAYVEQSYRVLLGRASEPEGFRAWLAYIDRTGDYDTLVAGFINSQEYRTRLGLKP